MIDILGKSAEELAETSRKMLLSLNEEEMKAIQAHYEKLGRNPTDVELEAIAQTWSEHCKHKIFNGIIDYEENGRKETIDSLFNSYIRKATDEIKRNDLVSVFKDNAGIVSFDKNHDIAFKAETHNHPSALDPFGGASTGVGGVIRDVLGAGLGAKPIFNTDVFCVAPPDLPPPDGILHPKRILKGVIAGVRDYGNPVGIPTINGSVHFHESFLTPLVFCGTAGIMPKGMHEKKTWKGDIIVVIGGRTGRDGIHGATFSSAELGKNSPTSAVQIGSPIEEKKVMDAILKARDRKLYNHITDCGGGGFSSAIGETARNTGCIVHLDKAPLKYPGLEPWEIWLSESQERMVVAMKRENLGEFMEICEGEGVEAAAIGEYTDDRKITLKYREETVAELDCGFLHDGVPRQRRKAVWKKKNFREPDFPDIEKGSAEDWLKKILASWAVCSKEFIIRQYDHEVQANTVLKPLSGYSGPSDAAIVKPLHNSSRCIVVSNGINPLYSTVDAYWMAASCIDEALRNIIASGGSVESSYMLDNFCLGAPNEENLAELVRAAKACYDFATAFGVPFISGKDSFYNEFRLANKTVSILPTLLISAVSITDAKRITSMDAKEEGSLIYVLGETFDELGGSQYYYLQDFNSGNAPEVNAERAKKLFSSLGKAIEAGLVKSCHDCSEGGLAAALAEMAFAGNLGMSVDLRKVPTALKRNDKIMFSESNSRFVAEVSPGKKDDFEKSMKGSIISNIGRLTKEKDFAVTGLSGKEICNIPIDELKEAWQKPMRW